MRTIIAGSRGITDYAIVEQFLEAYQACGNRITEVVSGGARGVDRLGEQYAKAKNIPIRQFIPDWDLYGKRAGFLRNIDMGNYAEALVAFWDGESRGTKQMIDYAIKKGLVVKVFKVQPTPVLIPKPCKGILRTVSDEDYLPLSQHK